MKKKHTHKTRTTSSIPVQPYVSTYRLLGDVVVEQHPGHIGLQFDPWTVLLPIVGYDPRRSVHVAKVDAGGGLAWCR